MAAIKLGDITTDPAMKCGNEMRYEIYYLWSQSSTFTTPGENHKKSEAVTSLLPHWLWVMGKKFLSLPHDQVKTWIYLCKELKTGNECGSGIKGYQYISQVDKAAIENRTKSL